MSSATHRRVRIRPRRGLTSGVPPTVADTSKPTILSAIIPSTDPTRLNLTYSEPMNAAISAAVAFLVTGGSHPFTAHTLDDSTHSHLTTSTPFVGGETSLLFGYAQPVTNKMQDLAGNLLDPIPDNLVITNNLPGAGLYVHNVGFGTTSDFAPVVSLRAGAKVIFVDEPAHGGNDANSGLILEGGGPKATPQAGWQALRDGLGDWLLFADGSSYPGWFGGNIANRTGFSKPYPIVVSTYDRTDPTNPAKWRKGRATIGTAMGVDAPNGDESLLGGATGIRCLLENLIFGATLPKWYIFNIISGNIARGLMLFNIIFRENVQCSIQCNPTQPDGDGTWVSDVVCRGVVFAHNARGQGLYLWKTDGIVIQDCYGYHNGWDGTDRDTAAYPPDIFKHNFYQGTVNRNPVFERNMSVMAGSHGLQARGGGFIDDNVFLDNPLNSLVGGGDFYWDINPLGVPYKYRRNTEQGATFIITSLQRGGGAGFQGTNNDPSSEASYNLIVNRNYAPVGGEGSTSGAFAASTGGIPATTNTWLNAFNNTCYGWGTQSVEQRRLDDAHPGQIILTLNHNVFPNDAPSGTNVQTPGVPHPDPTRTAITYAAANGYANKVAMFEFFVDNWVVLSGGNWVLSNYTSSVGSYIRAGFTIGNP